MRPEEQEQLQAAAEELGVERPFAGPYLRQNWGTCVFYAEGCRIHAELGVERKPRVCRTFPVLGARVDPACFHPGPATGAGSLPWDDLTDGRAAARWVDGLPLAAVLDGPVLGQLTVRALRPLIGAEPAVVRPARRSRVLDAIEVLSVHGGIPQPDVRGAVHGGAQLLAGAGADDGLPAWIRLLKLGLFGREL